MNESIAIKKRGLKFYARIYGKILVQDLKSKMSYRADFIISTIGMIISVLVNFKQFVFFMKECVLIFYLIAMAYLFRKKWTKSFMKLIWAYGMTVCK